MTGKEIHMTFLEKLEREHPEFIGEKFPGGVAICPEDCGYEKSTHCGAMTTGKFDTSACMACWGREVPEKTDFHANDAAMARNDEEGGGGHG